MTLEVRNPGLNDLVAADAPIERIAGGLGFTEGPVWRGGALLFSDIPNNRIARWRRLARNGHIARRGHTWSNTAETFLTIVRDCQLAGRDDPAGVRERSQRR